MFRTTAILATALTFSQTTSAEGSKAYSQCMGGASSHSQMTACIQSESSLQDARLNEAYKQLMDKLAPPEKMTMRLLQRSWITSRDSTCEIWGGLGHATVSKLERAMCIKELTEIRANELERKLQSEG